MAEIKITYSADTAIAVTAWSTGLAADQWASSALVDNSSTLYVDALVGGLIELDATTPAAGDTLEIYVAGQYDDAAATRMTAGIDALFDAATEEAPGTGFMAENLRLLEVVACEANEGYHWGPTSVASAFGGILPRKWFLVLHNNTSATCAATPACNFLGITYTSA